LGFERVAWTHAEPIQSRGDRHGEIKRQAVVYGERESQRRSAGELVSWSELQSLLAPAGCG
jgi:hypothetical protein